MYTNVCKSEAKMTDLEIAENIKLKKIKKIAKKLHYHGKIILFGEYKAKLPIKYGKKHGKLILVTAINPTKFGIGKTTVSIGLADAMNKIGKNCCLALREPSLGPVFGIKGGATGGGYSQIAPMVDINLHFNGDFHAITSANNLLCSLIDNHIYQGNELNIDENRILFHRCLDLNDRALRNVVVANGEKDGAKRIDNFTITAASEIMAIMCLATDLENLKERLKNIIVAYNKDGGLVYAKDLKAQDSMAILLKDALMPNLVQTLYKTPALVHLGPFANIAHGCNSVIATKMALSYCDYVVTEAGFGADLGAEKFLDIKCRTLNTKPNCVVLVATIGALKLNGGVEDYDELPKENLDAVKKGMENLYAHINAIYNEFKLPLVVTLNKYKTDTENEINVVKHELEKINIDCIVNDVWGKGADGAVELAKAVDFACDMDNSHFEYAYNVQDSIEQKINDLAKKIYGASGVVFLDKAKQTISELEKQKLDKLPIVIAKTQYSLSDNQKLLGRPKDFEITIRDLEIKGGAGFIVALAGNMLLMPGLAKVPSAVKMKIDENGKIEGIF